jgi:sarcosine oxidase subunit gamma
MVESAARSVPSVAATPWLKAMPPALRLIFQGDALARSAAAAAWDVAFSEEACRAVVGDGRATLWLGPDEFLLLAGDLVSASTIAESLEQVLATTPHSLVDVSHRQFAIEVSGPHAESILSGACPLDLNAAEFPVGMCTRTVLAKADIVLWRTRPDAFHLEVWRSFSGYVTGLLSEIAREFYGE